MFQWYLTMSLNLLYIFHESYTYIAVFFVIISILPTYSVVNLILWLIYYEV